MSKKENLRRMLDDPDYRPARIFAVTIQVLVVVSLIAYSLTTLPGLAPETRASLYFLEAITIGIFAVEYILRVMMAQNKLRFIFSFYGLVDLIAIIPFIIASRLDLVGLRLFRVLRMARYCHTPCSTVKTPKTCGTFWPLMRRKPVVVQFPLRTMAIRVMA